MLLMTTGRGNSGNDRNQPFDSYNLMVRDSTEDFFSMTRMMYILSFYRRQRQFPVPESKAEHTHHHRGEDPDDCPQKVEELVEAGVHFRTEAVNL